MKMILKHPAGHKSVKDQWLSSQHRQLTYFWPTFPLPTPYLNYVSSAAMKVTNCWSRKWLSWQLLANEMV